MKKILFMIICGLFTLWLVLLTNHNGQNKQLKPVGVAHASVATTGVTLTTTVLDYGISISITSGATIAFGNLTPGTPICNPFGSTFAITTNASNGYTIGLSDGSDTNSSMAFSTYYIPDATSGTLATPVTWQTGNSAFQGLGVSNWSDVTTKEVKWGAGTTVCDAANKYTFVPSATAAFHTVTGYRAAADNSLFSWKIDAPTTQITGAYSGIVTATATSVVT